MVWAVVLGGGSGSRFGAQVPKQFLPVRGVPVIVRAVRAFTSNPRVDRVVVSVGEDFVEMTRELMRAHFHDRRIYVIPGGKDRNGTMLRLLDHIASSGDAEEDDLILTHDAARPFIDARIVDANIDAARETGACGTAVPAVDTMVLASDGLIDTPLDRSRVYHMQTPQSFRLGTLVALYRRLTPEEAAAFTDACSVFVHFGYPVRLVDGDRSNIKITYPSDLELAERIAEGRDPA